MSVTIRDRGLITIDPLT